MKNLWLLLFLLPLGAAAQATRPAPCTLANGGTCKIGNANGANGATFEEIPAGSPASVSVTVQGCMINNTCDAAADTNTSTSAANRAVTFTKSYDYFLVTATLSGGSSPTVTITPIVSTAPPGAGGSAVTVTNIPHVIADTGSTTAATQATGTNLHTVVDSLSGNVSTQPAGFGAIVAFQQAVTASAVVLATNAVHGFCVKALINNGLTVYVGPSGVSTATGYPLAAGESICYQASNTNLAFVISSNVGSSVAVSGN